MTYLWRQYGVTFLAGLSGKCEKCTCSMRAVKKVLVPFGRGESCQ